MFAIVNITSRFTLSKHKKENTRADEREAKEKT